MNNRVLLFISVLTICVISRSEADFFIPCIPGLQKHFGLSAFATQLALSFNFLGYCLGMLVAGLLGDSFNKRTIIIYSLVIFAFSTLICASATNYGILLLGRFLQGATIAGPTALVYVVLIDYGSFNDQLKTLGLINGILTLVMASVPAIGGYLGLYTNWRFNFIVVLFLTMVALLLSYRGIYGKQIYKRNATLSLKLYVPLLKSKKLMLFTLTLCFMITPYWLFISMSPIYYVNDLGVPLIEYIYYKNILVVIFGVVSMSNGLLVKFLGCKNSLFLSIFLCVLSGICQFIIVILDINDPKIIISSMGILSAGSAFLINFLYTNALTIANYNIGKISALIHATRLIFTSIALGIVSKLYHGNFLVIGVPIVAMLGVGLYLTIYLYRDSKLKGI